MISKNYDVLNIVRKSRNQEVGCNKKSPVVPGNIAERTGGPSVGRIRQGCRASNNAGRACSHQAHIGRAYSRRCGIAVLPMAFRGSTPPWSRARVGRGTQTKAQYTMQRPGHTGRKALAKKKST